MTSRSRPGYDAIVVGARCAGAATAMLLARAGARVLLLDRAHPGTDTLSTHALMRAGVLQLARWRLLDEVVAAGTPAITATAFHYGHSDDVETVQIRPGGGVDALYAPRRTVLDAILVDAARRAGADVRFGVDVTSLRTDGHRITGVSARLRGGGALEARAPITVGADGVRSTVARLVRAPVTHRTPGGSAIVYGYWPRIGSRYEWFYRPGATAGVVPTNGGEACVWAGLPAASFATRRAAGLEQVFADTLAMAAPALVHRLGSPSGPLRGFPGLPGTIRQATGPGWALVGDSGSFKDPLTAHGITDALRDAELLARAVLDDRPEAFGHTRDRLSLPLFELAGVVASYRWDLTDIRELLRAESAAMRPEVHALLALDAPAAA